MSARSEGTVVSLSETEEQMAILGQNDLMSASTAILLDLVAEMEQGLALLQQAKWLLTKEQWEE